MFMRMLGDSAQRANSWLCVGLDPQPRTLPTSLRHDADGLYRFCTSLIEATADVACAFKPNSAFFEAHGAAGFDTLRRVIAAVPRHIPVILDAKRGDIGSTATAYASAAFKYFDAHAITLNPYLGGDALEPFLRYEDRGCFILCKTSNAGSADLQNATLQDGQPVYLDIARRAQHEWNGRGNVGLVVGATHPQIAEEVRALCPTMPFLVPGVGAQGGDLAAAVRAAATVQGTNALINASRSIMYASGESDYLQAARTEAIRLRDAINAATAEASVV